MGCGSLTIFVGFVGRPNSCEEKGWPFAARNHSIITSPKSALRAPDHHCDARAYQVPRLCTEYPRRRPPCRLLGPATTAGRVTVVIVLLLASAALMFAVVQKQNEQNPSSSGVGRPGGGTSTARRSRLPSSPPPTPGSCAATRPASPIAPPRSFHLQGGLADDLDLSCEVMDGSPRIERFRTACTGGQLLYQIIWAGTSPYR